MEIKTLLLIALGVGFVCGFLTRLIIWLRNWWLGQVLERHKNKPLYHVGMEQKLGEAFRRFGKIQQKMGIDFKKGDTKMTKEKLLEKIKDIDENYGKLDKEKAHIDADNLLLEFIDDEEITEAYKKIDKWYA